MRISDWSSDVCSSDLILAAKLPLGLLVLALAGVPLAFRRALPAPARWTLAMVAAACGFHMLALVGSDGIWGGVRHAMPALVGAAILAGGVLAWEIGRASCRARVCPYG